MLSAYRRFKKNTPLRKLATPGLVRGIKKFESGLFALNRRLITVQHHSRYKAICHIGLQKTGTVWFREMLSDPEIYRYSGLNFRDCAGKREGISVTDGGIYAPIRQIDDEIISQIKPSDVATLFVIRNPLSITLSWINSTERYHITGRGDRGMSERRDALKGREMAEKVSFAVSHFSEQSRFEKIERLLELAERSENIFPVRYEDCTGKADEAFQYIFSSLDIGMPDKARRDFVTRHSFETYSGRKISEKASPGAALQGRTHLEIEKFSEAERDQIFQAVGPRLRARYEHN